MPTYFTTQYQFKTYCFFFVYFRVFQINGVDNIWAKGGVWKCQQSSEVYAYSHRTVGILWIEITLEEQGYVEWKITFSSRKKVSALLFSLESLDPTWITFWSSKMAFFLKNKILDFQIFSKKKSSSPNFLQKKSSPPNFFFEKKVFAP